jgi:hypothetical protein
MTEFSISLQYGLSQKIVDDAPCHLADCVFEAISLMQETAATTKQHKLQ